MSSTGPRGSRLCAYAVAALVWLAASPAPGGEALISEHTHVVVLVGIPGDSETESTYGQQVERLLELLARGRPRAHSVTVLSDAPDLVRIPAGLAVQIHEASKEALQEFTSTLEAEELVVFAWGHGGLRGRDPVLHVRGPRIEPSDLVALARRAERSSWLLYFRQSGSFARGLVAPGRALLTSEAERAFGNDPIGFGLVLDLLSEHPRTSVEELAGRLGPATTSWYEQNRLARTEEPTLWLEEQEPILVARSSGVGLSDTKPGENGESVGDPSGPWSEIEPASPEAYPGAPAVVLRRNVVHALGTNPKVSTVVEEFIQVLTHEGERYAEVDVSFSPPGESLRILDLERRAPDGSIERLSPGLFGGPQSRTSDEDSPAAANISALPGAEPGAIFRIRYRREWKSFPLPHVYLEVPLATPLPVQGLSVEVRASSDGAFHWGFRNRDRVAPETSDGRYGRMYRWQFSDLDALLPESLVAPARAPTLLVSTFPDWRAFSAWYRRLILQADEITPEISAMAARLTANASSAREKVERIAKFVTGLRYVAVPLGVNSHRPHAAANVLRNRYGDCKDKANLLNTMLASLGIEAHLVLVPRFTQADTATPGLGFNHAISRVRVDGRTIWIDTTDETTRFGVLPPGDPGRNVLVIEDGTAELTMLPEPVASDNRLDLSTDIRLGERVATARIQGQAEGFADYQLRVAAQQVTRIARNAPLLSLSHHTLAGHFSLAEQNFTDVSDLGRAFSWSADGSFGGLVVTAPGGSRLLQAPFWLPDEWSQALHRRRAPLYLNDGYPFELTQTLRFHGDIGLAGARLPIPASGRSESLSWRLDWSREDEAVVARLQITLRHAELTVGTTGAFQEELRRLRDALAIGIRLPNS